MAMTEKQAAPMSGEHHARCSMGTARTLTGHSGSCPPAVDALVLAQTTVDGTPVPTVQPTPTIPSPCFLVPLVPPGGLAQCVQRSSLKNSRHPTPPRGGVQHRRLAGHEPGRGVRTSSYGEPHSPGLCLRFGRRPRQRRRGRMARPSPLRVRATLIDQPVTNVIADLQLRRRRRRGPPAPGRRP